jgi:hypothetical protein
MSHWASIIKDRTESGLSVKAYCEQEGFHQNKYFYWQKKLRLSTHGQLCSMQLGARGTGLVPAGFTEIKVTGAHNNPQRFEPTCNGEIRFNAGSVQFAADGKYPPENIVTLLRRLTQLC